MGNRSKRRLEKGGKRKEKLVLTRKQRGLPETEPSPPKIPSGTQLNKFRYASFQKPHIIYNSRLLHLDLLRSNIEAKNRMEMVDSCIFGFRKSIQSIKRGRYDHLLLSIGDYDSDPRELQEIRQVQEFMRLMIIGLGTGLFHLNTTPRGKIPKAGSSKFNMAWQWWSALALSLVQPDGTWSPQQGIAAYFVLQGEGDKACEVETNGQIANTMAEIVGEKAIKLAQKSRELWDKNHPPGFVPNTPPPSPDYISASIVN